jgi:hypothetical protein
MIGRRNDRWRRPWRLVLAFAGLHVFFAVRASLPQPVICHKAGGGSAVEFDTAGVCQCEECEHCRARRMAPRSGPAVPGFEECHCQHESIYSDVGHSSLRLPDRHPFLDPASGPAEFGFEPPAARIALPAAEEASGRSPGPPERPASLLRC